MTVYNPEIRLAQPFRDSVKGALLRCIDMAATPSDAKSMILTMYESGLLSVPETFAQIETRGLESE